MNIREEDFQHLFAYIPSGVSDGALHRESFAKFARRMAPLGNLTGHRNQLSVFDLDTRPAPRH